MAKKKKQSEIEPAFPAATVEALPGALGPIDMESGEFYRLLIEGVQDYAIFALDPKGYVLSWNAGAQRFKGYTASEIVGKHFSIFYPRDLVAEGFPEFELRTAANVGRFEDEGLRVRKDRSTFWAHVLITAIRNRAGELIGFAKVTRDLTERREAERRALEDARRVAIEETARRAAEIRERETRDLADQLRDQARDLAMRTEEAEEARRRADEANRAKAQFLAAMSHELRTPLNAIGGYAQLLSMGVSGPLADAQLEQLARIKRSQEHLLGIINDILNFSRIEAGQLTYRLARIPLHEVVGAVTTMIDPQARSKSIRLDESGCRRDVFAWADRSKVEQIVLNLVSNAIKFTPAGGVITCVCGESEDNRVYLDVTDTGCGIAPDQLGPIFEPFVQVGRSLTAAQEGTGLGLSISRDLARAMGGDILVESTVGVGSRFRLELPSRSTTQES